MDLYEALYTTRAMRRVHPDPVPEEVVRIMLDAAVRAPTGGNLQQWRFLTVTDPEVKRSLGPLYRRAWNTLQTTVYAGVRERAEAAGDDQTLRILRSSQWLADHFEEVPLWILAFDRSDPTGGSIFPAVWSMMLAARARGWVRPSPPSWDCSNRRLPSRCWAFRPMRAGVSPPRSPPATRRDAGVWRDAGRSTGSATPNVGGSRSPGGSTRPSGQLEGPDRARTAIRSRASVRVASSLQKAKRTRSAPSAGLL